MALFLEVTEGPDLGKKFLILKDDHLGRGPTEVRLTDPKVSSIHAQVQLNEDGKFILVDKNSFNGIKHNGQKVLKLPMEHGVRFTVGKTTLSVIEDNAPGIESSRKSTEEKPSQEDLWKQELQVNLPKIAIVNKAPTIPIKAFDPAIELNFIAGIQADTKITLGYGPRIAGSDVLDIELRESTCPDIAFELLPDEGGVRFVTSYPQFVLLNEVSTPSQLLHPGDRIKIGASLIEVSFLT